MAKPPTLASMVRVLRLTYADLTALLPLTEGRPQLQAALSPITTRLLRVLNRADASGRSLRRPPRS